MIIDKIKNAKLYYGIGRNFEKALKFLEENQEKFADMETGKHFIEGIDHDEIFYLIKRYDSFPVAECKLENHHLYADIQLVVKGKEYFCYAPLDRVKEIDPHPENDNYYFSGDCEPLTLKDDLFVVVLPDDAHMPERAINEVREPIVKLLDCKIKKIKFPCLHLSNGGIFVIKITRKQF